MTQTVLILGANGAFGRRAAEAFETAGWTTRRYTRGTDIHAAARGADVIVNAMNPPMYHNWRALVPQITRQAIAAAKSSGATLIVPGNVYVYGDAPGPWSEATPHRPAARKGRIRSEMEAAYGRAVSEQGIRVILLRGGDFIDPRNPATALNMLVLKHLSRNVMVPLGPLGTARAYAYLPDMTRAAVALAEKRAELDPYEEVNMPGLTFTMGQLRTEVARLTGRRPRLLPFPWWMTRLAAPFHELSRELLEMRYLYRTPHRLAGEKFHRLLPGFREAPFEQVMARQVAAVLPSGQLQVHENQPVA